MAIDVIGTTVNVKDYGAVGDDTHDDTSAFRDALKAIRGTGGTCFVPEGTYKIAPTGIMGSNDSPALSDNMHLVGEYSTGDLITFLHVHSDALAIIILCSGNAWSIENIGIDMSGFYGGENKVPVSVGTQTLAAGWMIDNCWFLDTGYGAIVARGRGFQISSCHITNSTIVNSANGRTPVAIRIVTQSPDAGYPSYGKFLNNVIIGAPGFYTIGNNHLFKNNTVSQASYAAGFYERGTSGLVAANRDNTYIGNVASYSSEGANNDLGQSFAQANGFEVWTPYTFMFNNTANNNCGAGFALGCSKSVLAFNRSVDNGFATGNPLHIHRSGFSSISLEATSQAFVNNSSTLYFCNVAHDTRPSADMTQQYGIRVWYDNIRCLSVVGNNFHGNELGEGFYRNNQPNVSIQYGRDMFHNTCDEKQRDILKSLLNGDAYNITEDQYNSLNSLLQ